MSYVRKLSVGPNFPDGAVHYQAGKAIFYNKDEQRKTHEISHIIEERDEAGFKFFDIYIKNIPTEGEVVSEVKWKSVPFGIYTVVEYAIDFE